ncbi:MAG: hypothetical protein H0T62_10215 [Parachlamydiaceae bacterium]|nr:hypothetical protein [Parachlamydiaceae bacterium]
MSAGLSNRRNLNLPNHISSANYDFTDDSMEELDSGVDETITRTADLAQNSIPNAGNNSIPNANVDSDLSGRVAPMDPQGSPLLTTIIQLAKPLLTEYIPQALLISAGIAICVLVPTTLGVGALGFVPLLFFGAMYLYTPPNADEIKAIQQQSEILNQRVGMLKGLDKLTREIETLEKEQNETGGSEALTAKKETKIMEREKAWESLKKFDMQYGIDSSAFKNTENLEGSDEAEESSGIENLSSGNVNHPVVEEEDDEIDEDRLTQISTLREQVAQLNEEIELARDSKSTVQNFDNLKSSLSNHKLLLADLLKEEILATEEKAALLVDQEDEEGRLYDSIEKMQTEYDILMQNLADEDEDYSKVNVHDFDNDANFVTKPATVKQKPSNKGDEYAIISDSDTD